MSFKNSIKNLHNSHLMLQRGQVHRDVWARAGDRHGEWGRLGPLRLLARRLTAVLVQYYRGHTPLLTARQVSRLPQDILRLVPWVREVQVRHEDLGAQTGCKLLAFTQAGFMTYKNDNRWNHLKQNLLFLKRFCSSLIASFDVQDWVIL